MQRTGQFSSLEQIVDGTFWRRVNPLMAISSTATGALVYPRVTTSVGSRRTHSAAQMDLILQLARPPTWTNRKLLRLLTQQFTSVAGHLAGFLGGVLGIHLLM